MRLAIKLPCFLIILGAFIVFSGKGTAALDEKPDELPRNLQTQSERPSPPRNMEWQDVTLEPFFLFQGEGPRAWVERIIVTFQVAVERNGRNIDVTDPNIRKAFYDLLRSGQPETAIKCQALASLNRQAKMEAVAAMKISKSILIVR